MPAQFFFFFLGGGGGGEEGRHGFDSLSWTETAPLPHACDAKNMYIFQHLSIFLYIYL